MYDTLNIRHYTSDALRALPALSDVAERTDGSYSGRLNELRVYLRPGSVSLSGSLHKYAAGANYGLFTRTDVKQAVERLSDEMSLKMGDARVFRLDAGVNITTEKPPEAYIGLLGEAKRLKKSLYDTKGQTALYANKQRAMQVYDKVAEVVRHKGARKSDFQGANMLRVELQLKKRLTEQLGATVELATIAEKSFFNKVCGMLLETYLDIEKLPGLESEFTAGAAGDVDDFFWRKAIEAVGGYSKALLVLETARASGSINRQQLARKKKKIREVYNTPVSGGGSAIEELDCKVIEALETVQG